MPRRLLTSIASAPLAALLAVPSVAITMLVVLATVVDGRVPRDAPVGLIFALLIGGVAATEASRPARSDRTRRRFGARREGGDEPS